MADPSRTSVTRANPGMAWPDNVGGSVQIGGRRVSFYVDRECILCRACTERAPRHFRLSVDEDHDIVHRQPATPEELRSCNAAMAACPVGAIGDDGL